MKILGRLTLILSFFLLSFVVSSKAALAAAPSCGDFQPTTNCVCDQNRTETNNYCFPLGIQGCSVISGACHCGSDSNPDIVVADGVCSGLGNNNGSSPTDGKTTGVFGAVTAPKGVAEFNKLSPSGIGLIPFISRIIQIATIVAGIIVFMNFILAGYNFITSDGSSKVTEQVKNQLTYSVLGLVIIVASYTIIAIISLLIFGKADFILNPTISGPTPTIP